MATKKTLGVTNEIENLITNAITTEIQSAIEESKSKATRKKGSVNIETEIIITPEMVFNLNEVQTQLAQMKETFREAYDVIKQYNEDLNYDLEKSFKARIPDILSLKNKFDALRSTINSNQGEKISKFDIGMSKKTLERLYEELQSEYDAMSSNFRKAHPIIKVDEWMAPITSELYDSIEKLKKEAAGFTKEISESMEKIVEEIEKPVKKKSKKKIDIGDQLQETAQKAKSAVKELSEVNGKVKEFYDTFGSPSKALDIGYFANLEEVLKTLGGTFEEFKESEDAFDESRVNLEFFKELAKQTMLTNDEVEELQKSFSELDFLLSGEASKFSSSVSIGRQVTEELDKIQKIFNGEFFQSNPMEDFFPMGELEEDLDSVENEVEEFSDHLTKGMSKSRNYVIDLKTAFLNLIDNIQQLNSEDDPEWIDRYNDDINELLSKYPELEKFKNQFSTLSDARDFIKTDAWYDFLGTLPKAREYLEEIGESDRIVASQPITINSSKNIEEEKEMVEQTSKAFDVASESKIDFVKANESVANAAENSVEPINRETEAARDLSEAFKNATDSKRQFIEANKELANTTNNSTSSIEEAATNLVNAGLKAAAVAQDSNSPSKKYDKLGKDAVDGYANGIKEKTEEVNKAVSSMVESGIDAAKESSLIDKETTALEKLNEQLREYNKLKDKDQRSVARNSMAQFMLDNGIGLDQLTKSQQKILSSTYNKLNQSNLLSNVEPAIEEQDKLREKLHETAEAANQLLTIYRAIGPYNGGILRSDVQDNGTFWGSDGLDVHNFYEGHTFKGQIDKSKVKTLTIDAKGKSWNEIKYNHEIYTTDELLEHAKQQGYELLEILNVADGAGDSVYGVINDAILKNLEVYIDDSKQAIRASELLEKTLTDPNHKNPIIPLFDQEDKTSDSSSTNTEIQKQNELQQELHETAEAVEEVTQAEEKQKKVRLYKDKSGQYTFIAQGKQKKNKGIDESENKSIMDQVPGQYTIDEYLKTLPTTQADWVLGLPRISKEAVQQQSELNHQIELTNTNMQRLVNLLQLTYKIRDAFLKDIHMSTGEQNERLLLSGTKPVIDVEYRDVTNDAVETAKATAEATAEENTEMNDLVKTADKATTAKKKFAKANKEDAQSAKETTTEVKKENEAFDETGNSVDDLTGKLKDLEKEQKGYIRVQQGRNDDANNRYTEALSDFVNKRVTKTTDPLTGKVNTQEQYLISYDKIARKLIAIDKKRLDWIHKIENANEEQIQALQAGLIEIENERGRLENVFNEIATNRDLYVADANQIEIVRERRRIAEILNESEFNAKNTGTPSINKQITTMITNMNQLKTISKDLFKGDETSVDRFINQLRNVNKLYEVLITKGTQTTQNKTNKAFDTAFEQMSKSIFNSKEFAQLGKGEQSYFETIFNRSSIQDLITFSQKLNEFRRRIIDTKTELTTYKPTFIEKLGSALKSNIGRLATTYLSITDLVRYFRQAVQVVTELDSALTELRVVSNASDYVLKDISKQAFQLGQRLGSTTAEVVKSITDWRRLGETVESSLALAEQAARLSVGGLMEVSTATESLVSAMKAYGYAVEDVSQIVDKFIYIGNNYSITSEDLATSLEKSSGALVAAGNSLEEAVALEVAGNTVIQDANAVSNALKAISMRLRGTSGSALEEIGEDTEGLVENASKLYEIVKRLTKTASNPEGVEIINKANNSYKSTYEILLEISKVWNEIGDVQQAELLEKLAGKVRGSAVAAILSQGDILESAYYDAMNNAEGAGEKAIENSLNSIEKKLQQFKNETKNLMTDVIESNTIKSFIDFGTQAISVLDKIIPKISLLGSVLGTLGGGLVQKLLTRGSSLKEFFGFSHFFKMFDQDDWKHLNKYFTALKSGKTQVEALQTSMVGASRMATNFAKKIDADNASLGLLSVKAKLGAQGLTLLSSAVRTIVSISIGFAITALVTYLSDLAQAEKDVVKNANELFDKYNDNVKKIEDYNKEIKKLTDQLNNENITQSEAYQIRSDLYDIQQDLIKSYGFEADALDLLNKKYTETNDTIKEKLQLDAKDILNESYKAYNKATEELNENKSYFLGDYSSLVGGITNNDIFNDQQFLNDISPYAYEFNNPVHRGLSFTLRSTLKDSEKDLKAFSEMLSKYYDKYPDLVKGVREEIAKQLTKLSKDEDYQADIKQIDEYSNALMQSTNEYYEYSKAISEYKSAVIAGDTEQIQKSINQIIEYKDKVKDLAYTDMSAEDNETVRSAFTDMLDIDFSQGYRQVFQKGLLDLDNKELQDALKNFADENEGAWSKTISDLQFGGKNGYSEALVNTMLDSLNIPKTEKNIDLALEELVNYFNESGKATLEDAKPLTYEKWLQATSNIKKDEKTNYTNAEAQAAYKTAISQITEYAKKNPKERINFADMFSIVAGDELFKQLHMDDFNKYLVEAENDSIKAVILFAQDALDSFDETIDLNISEEDKEIFKSQMLDIQMAALGASDNILVLENSYWELKGVLDQVDEGWKEEDLKPIIEQYTELAGDVEYLENGMVTLRKDGVESLINTFGTASNEAISSMSTIIDKFGESSDIIQNFYKQIRIAALEAALTNYKVSMSLSDIYDIYERAKDNPDFATDIWRHQTFGEDTMKVWDAMREIEAEIKGIKLKETDTNHSGSGSGNKKADNEIDWIANSLENIQKQIDKTQEKYDRLFTVSGSDEKLTEANGFLTDINNLLDKQIKGYDLAAKAYERELNALGLSAEELEIIKNVALDNSNAWMIERFNTDNEKDQKKYERLQEGLKFYQNEQDAYAKKREKMHQKEENNIQALQNEYDNLGAKIAQVEAQLTPETSVKKQQKYNEELIDLYTQQYDKEIQIAYAKDELIKATELQAAKEQKVNELIAQGRQYSIDAATARYDRLLGEYENRQRVLEHGIAMAEGQGSLVSTNYYKALIDNERATINDSLKARDEMVDKLHQIEADGIYSKEDLEQWQAAKDKIDDMTGSIYESEEAILSWKNAMRQVKWDVFDRIQETIGRVADEADYLIESLSSKDLFEWTKEIWGTDGTQTKVFYGEWADEGIATLGLHQLKIADYKEQVENYREEIRRLYKDIADHPTDLTLIDRKNQLIDAERQLALSVKQEEQAILDLVRDGYDKQLNSLQELINKYNEALASEKD